MLNHGRLKCDRARPCDNCVKRRESETCVYPVASAVRDQARASKRTKKRLDRLESLVMSLIDRNVVQNNHSQDGRAVRDGQEQSLKQYQTTDSVGNETNLDNGRISDNELPLDKPSIPTSSSSSALWESVLRDVSPVLAKFVDEWYTQTSNKVYTSEC